MRAALLFSLSCALLGAPAAAEPPAPPTATELVAAHSHAFQYVDEGLTGPGAEFLRSQTARSQFVLLGEDHMDHEVPIFAGALYRMLHELQGFRYLVVEQDPVAIEEALAEPTRGDVEALGAVARSWTSLYEFDSDQDLALLALVGRVEPRGPAIWGVEQATGASRYLAELVRLAPDPAARSQVEALLERVRMLDPGPSYSVNWLASREAEIDIAALAAVFNAPSSSRASRLLTGLAKSAEIFGYYRRAEAGEFVGLYNNTVRESLLKTNFLEHYRAAEKISPRPKAMFKFGSNHLYHGKNPTQAFPVGNLAHELAIANDAEAYGLFVVTLGPNYRSYSDYPAWLRALMPATEPTVPTIVDLKSLRRFQRVFRASIEPADVWEQMALLHGYDALVILPGSKPATRSVGGRAGY